MAIDFTNSIGQNVNFGSLSGAIGLSVKSLLCWLYIDSASSSAKEAFVISASSPNEALFLIIDYGNGTGDAGKLTFLQYFTTQNGEWYSTNDVLTAASLNFIGITYDATSVTNDPVIYVNGSSVGITERTAPSGSVRSGTSSVLYVGGVGPSIDGKIASLCYYNRILSASEIADAYASKLAIPTWRGLVFAPQLHQRGEVGEGGTLTASHTIACAISGALGQPSGSPLHRQDAYLTY